MKACSDCGGDMGRALIRCNACQEAKRRELFSAPRGEVFACVVPDPEPLDAHELQIASGSFGLIRPTTRKAVAKVQDGLLSVVWESRIGVFNTTDLPVKEVRRATYEPLSVWLQVWPGVLKGLAFGVALSGIIVLLVTLNTDFGFLVFGVPAIGAAALVGGCLGFLVRALRIQRDVLLLSLYSAESVLPLYVAEPDLDKVIGILRRAGISNIEPTHALGKGRSS